MQSIKITHPKLYYRNGEKKHISTQFSKVGLLFQLIIDNLSPIRQKIGVKCHWYGLTESKKKLLSVAIMKFDFQLFYLICKLKNS